MGRDSLPNPVLIVFMFTEAVPISENFVVLKLGSKIVKIVSMDQRIRVDDLALTVVRQLLRQLGLIAQPRRFVALPFGNVKEENV